MPAQQSLTVEEWNHYRRQEWFHFVPLDVAQRAHDKNVAAVKQAWAEYKEKHRPLRILALYGSGRNRVQSCAHEESNSKLLCRAGLSPLYGDAAIEIEEIELRAVQMEPCNNCYATSSAWCHHPCLPASERVTGARFASIKDLMPGERVAGGAVMAAWQSSSRAKVLKVVLSDGRRVRLTANHLVKVVRVRRRLRQGREREYNWVPAGQLRRGDRIPFTTGGEFAPDSDRPIFLYLLAGLVWGDGTFYGKTREEVCLYYHAREQQFADKIKQQSSYPVSQLAHSIKDYTGMRKLAWGISVGRLLIALGLDKKQHARARRLPPQIMSASEKEACAFLRGWFDTDGSCDQRRPRVSLSAASFDCLRDAQLLLAKLGIRSCVADLREKHTILRGKKVRRTSLLSIYNHESIDRFAGIIGFFTPRKQARLASLVKKFRPKRNGFGNGTVFGKVVSVCPDGEEAVYDIAVDPGHEFIAEGVPVHNCSCWPFDGMQEMYPKVLRSDVLLMATGVNQSAMSSRLKVFLDRLISCDGGLFLDAGQYQMKSEDFKRRCLTLAASGGFSYEPRLAGKVAAYFITSKDANNDLAIPEPGDPGYETLVAWSLRGGNRDYGMLHADPWYVFAAARYPQRDLQFDKQDFSEQPEVVEQARRVVRAAVALAQQVRREGYVMPIDRLNRT